MIVVMRFVAEPAGFETFSPLPPKYKYRSVSPQGMIFFEKTVSIYMSVSGGVA